MTASLTLIRMLVGFVIAKVVAIYTGPTGMAMLGQVQSMVNSLNGIVNAPVGSGVIRFTAENHSNGYEACSPWWQASIFWVSVICLFIIPIGVFFAPQISNLILHDPKLSWIVVITVSLLPFTALGTLCNSVINGQQLYRRYVLLGFISTITSSVVMIGLIMVANIKGALLAASMQSALIGIVLIIANFNQPWFKVKFWWRKKDLNARKAIVGYMVMAFTTAICVPTSLMVNRNIIIENLGWEAAGIWQAVWKISEVYLSVITIALSTYYLPRLSSLKGVNNIVGEINKTAIVIVPLVFVLAILVYLFRDFLIALLFTSDFVEARNLFSLQLCGDVVKIASWLYAYPMLSRGATKWFVFTEIVFSVTFVVLTYCLVLAGLGLKGVTLAYLINYILYFILMFSCVKIFSR
ncbi:O-antigen translocase [Shewanella algae]|uniref:O-antigen translocase n=1 Tax=Shewanella algae TaxID=38313 RepID=UPI003AAD85B4